MALARRGDLLLSAGAGYEANVHAPLVAVVGDLRRVGILQLVYGLSDRVIVELDYDALRVLTVDSMGTPAVVPNEDLADSTSSGVSDLNVAVSFVIFGARSGFSAGARLEFNVPSSDQSLGLGILDAPTRSFLQNDVLVYAAELLYRPVCGTPLRLYAGVDGRVNTRRMVPVGTEDLGELRFGVDYTVGRWRLDAGGLIGYAGNSAEWGVGGGVSLLFGR